MSDFCTYKTVEKEASASFTEKRSEFIGAARPVSSVEEARDFIARIKSEHSDATHNVPAYVLRRDNIRHCSDDGEPSGTAGMPVMDVILKSGVTDVCVVVTRYFGGVLLGAGGLVRAYSHACTLALNAAGIAVMGLCGVYETAVDYSFYERLTKLLAVRGANIEGAEFQDRVTVRFSLLKKEAPLLSEELTQQSGGRYSITETGEKFAKI